ncbi:uroporphyrinogen-III synthase [Texcoconibacillus texcoconensis]|nr:uroporphyrinogen-III synthase [Texcoconibacillus texcoconensis]
MINGLTGKRIAFTSSRRTNELSTLIEKQNGVPVSRPLQGTTFFADHKVKEDILNISNEKIDLFVFTTGMGTEALIHLSEQLGVKNNFLHTIHDASIAVRGYKTNTLMRKFDIKTDIVSEDGTIKGLIDELNDYPFANQKVVVQLHGESAPELINTLEAKGATVIELLPYEHIPPEEETLQMMVEELLRGELGAVCFTTATQVRYLFQHVKDKANLSHVLDIFDSQTLAVGVGKVTKDALKEEGVKEVLTPENEKMGAMVVELSQYYQSNFHR